MIKKLIKWIVKTKASKGWLANALGIHPSVLSRVLHGKQAMPYAGLMKLPRITGGAVTDKDVLRYLKGNRKVV